MIDIIDRLNDEENYVDAIDDAIFEIQELRELLNYARPFVAAMVGIASDARAINKDINDYFRAIGKDCE